jgi:hypothetical protein
MIPKAMSRLAKLTLLMFLPTVEVLVVLYSPEFGKATGECKGI